MAPPAISTAQVTQPPDQQHVSALLILGAALSLYQGSKSCQAARREVVLLQNLILNVAAAVGDLSEQQLTALTPQAIAVQCGVASTVRTVCRSIAMCKDSCTPPTNLLLALTQLFFLQLQVSRFLWRFGTPASDVSAAVEEGVTRLLAGSQDLPGTGLTTFTPSAQQVDDLVVAVGSADVVGFHSHLWAIATASVSPARGWTADCVLDAAVLMLANLGRCSLSSLDMAPPHTLVGSAPRTGGGSADLTALLRELPEPARLLWRRIHDDAFQLAGLILQLSPGPTHTSRRAALRLLHAVVTYNQGCEQAMRYADCFVPSQGWIDGVTAAVCLGSPTEAPQATTEGENGTAVTADEAGTATRLLLWLHHLQSSGTWHVPDGVLQPLDAALSQHWPAAVRHALCEGTAAGSAVRVSSWPLLVTGSSPLDMQHWPPLVHAHLQGVWAVQWGAAEDATAGITGEEHSPASAEAQLRAGMVVWNARRALAPSAAPSAAFCDVSVGWVLDRVDSIMATHAPAGMSTHPCEESAGKLLQVLDAVCSLLSLPDAPAQPWHDAVLTRLFVCVAALPPGVWQRHAFLTNAYPTLIQLVCGQLGQRAEQVLADQYVVSALHLLQGTAHDPSAPVPIGDVLRVLQAVEHVPAHLLPDSWAPTLDRVLGAALQGAVRAQHLWHDRWAAVLEVLGRAGWPCPTFTRALLQLTMDSPQLFGPGLPVEVAQMAAAQRNMAAGTARV